MKRYAIFFFLIITCLATTTTAFGQKGCELQVVGTWKAASSDGARTLFYRFGPDATVKLLSVPASSRESELREINSAVYALDDAKAPKAILFKAAKAGGGLAEGTTSMEIAAYDDTSMTFVKPGSEPTRLVKVDPHRYFMVLAGRSGTFYDSSGPTFPMLIKMDGQQIQVDAVGIYSLKGNAAFGPVPKETYNEFMKEPHNDSEVMLRLELTGAQYERSVKVVRTWDRRFREGALLYPDPYLNNILFVRQVAESLNQCGENIKLYKLDWMLDDQISTKNINARAPFFFFKELRRLNESRHVRDEKFYGHQMQKQAGQ
ncbi:MAG TPA: hypothetical protein VF747_15790 [Blastocatellia bacterium]|jgi:hypothetical protein